MPLPTQVSKTILLRFKEDREVAINSFMQIFSRYANRLMICNVQASHDMDALTLGNADKELAIDLGQKQIKLKTPKGEFWFNYINNVGSITLDDPEDADEGIIKLISVYGVGKPEQFPEGIREKVAALRVEEKA